MPKTQYDLIYYWITFLTKYNLQWCLSGWNIFQSSHLAWAARASISQGRSWIIEPLAHPLRIMILDIKILCISFFLISHLTFYAWYFVLEDIENIFVLFCATVFNNVYWRQLYEYICLLDIWNWGISINIRSLFYRGISNRYGIISLSRV